jgi:ABC-type nitrate/sulfonate/bicarbonate transport system substrate-binding protein
MDPKPPTLRIAYVPEHYSLPLHLALPHLPPGISVSLHPFPSGTGAMIASLRSGEIDIAIGLTEGWVAGLGTTEGSQKGGYKVVGSWVETPLRWAVVMGRGRDDLVDISGLKGGKVGISRLGR